MPQEEQFSLDFSSQKRPEAFNVKEKSPKEILQEKLQKGEELTSGELELLAESLREEREDDNPRSSSYNK